MTGPLVLPDDIEIVPVTALSDAVRSQIGGTDDDYAVTRPLSRVPSKIVDSQAAAWLRQFKKPTTLVQAILRHSEAVERKPEEVLEDIYPFLESCLHAKLLVEPGLASQIIQPSFTFGTEIAGHRIEECIQVLADSELYRVTHRDHQAALKITRPEAGVQIKENFAREARIQERLNGRVAPRLLASGETDDCRAYVISEWIDGMVCTESAAVLRMRSRDPLPPALLSLCGAILDAYATLHSLGVTHADVHPGNILVERDGTVRIIDYGLSRMESGGDEYALIPRGGVGFFLDPEYAAAAAVRSTPPSATFAGDQYSIAALLYHLLSGRHHLDFSLEREALLGQILKGSPVPLAARGLPGVAALDRVLLRALAKEASGRFPDVASMAAAYHQNVLRTDSPQEDRTGRSNLHISTLRETQTREDWLNSFLDLLSGPEVASHLPGRASTASGLFRIACIREDANLLALAELCLDRAERDLASVAGMPGPGERSSGWCESAFTIAWLNALMAHSCWDFGRRAWAMEHFLQSCNLMVESRNASVNPSGLLASSLLLDAFRWDHTSNFQSIVDVGNKLLNRLWNDLDALSAVAAANGQTSLTPSVNWTECLYATLQWMRSVRAPAPKHLSNRLEQLSSHAGSRKASGRHPHHSWPLGTVSCPGDPAFVFLWSLASRVLGDPRWLSFAEAAGCDAANSYPEDRSLRGLVERAYSQLNLYKHTGDRCWLANAYEIANAAIRLANHGPNTPALETPSRFDEEELRLAVLLSDLAHPRCASMPFFEEECWPASGE